MKKPFNRIVGPEGEWIDGEGADARDEFAFRCLNAAVNLYGIVTMAEMTAIYNHYAKAHEPPVSNPMDEAELLSIAAKLLDQELDDTWFAVWLDDKSGIRRVVYNDLASIDHAPGEEPPPEDAKRIIDKRIADALDGFSSVSLKMLDEDDFFSYEDPMGDEGTPASNKLAKFLKKEYHISQLDADLAVTDIQSEFRVNGDSLANALEYVRDECDFAPEDRAGVGRLLEALAPVASTTRTWDYRGHTAREMSDFGLIDRLAAESIPDVFHFGDEDDSLDEDFPIDDEEAGEPVKIEELPPAKYTGPIDFKFVKDPARREQKLYDYEGVRIVTQEFVRHVVMKELTQEERRDAARRLGFALDPATGLLSNPTLDMVAGDFASMMDDQHGEPAIRRILKRKDQLGDYDRAAAAYYENYRYTWLEVLAVKAGVGVKCRNLMTGEELFLMETSFSQGPVKGLTVCAGIAPMGDVYLALGTIHSADFENPAAILKIVLTHLGLPTERPILLSFANQARFAAETIRRLAANGRFDNLVMG